MKKKLLSIITLATLVLSAPLFTHASEVTDDPGAGRLSGTNISTDFYDDDSEITDGNAHSTDATSKMIPYGSSQTYNPYTGKNYTHQDAFDGKPIVNGIDVSQWQRDIDWTKVKAAGIDFAFIRIGYRGYGKAGTLQYPYTDSNGNYKYGTKDPYYERNMQNATAAGVKVGVYIFSQAITEEEAKEEAEFILKQLGNYPISLPLVMDYEYASDASDGGRIKTAKLSKEQATKICMAFCQTVKDAGYTPMVYANKSMLYNQVDAATISASYPIWLANYTTNTDYNGTFQFWQYSSEGKVDGIEGRTDMNYYYAGPNDNWGPGTPANPTPSQPVEPAKPVIVDLAAASIAPIADQAYTGSEIKPLPLVSCNGKNLVLNTDYTVAYKNNVNLGTATVTITGTGNYKGTRQAVFKIAPKMVSGFKSKKTTETSITLKWSKMSDAKGYEIFRSTAVNGTYTKIATIKKNSTTTYTDSKLSPGQCYYYKIRCQKKVGKTTHYGVLTPAKGITTKICYTRKVKIKQACNLYAGTSTTTTNLQPLTVGSTYTVSFYTKDIHGAGWYYISGGNLQSAGYVPSSMVTLERLGRIAKSQVNLRKSPSTKSKIITTMKKNTKVTISKVKNKKGTYWYKVSFKKKKKTYTGWVSSPYIKQR